MSTQPLDIDALANELSPALLPDIVVDISSMIGYKPTLKLVQALGGVQFEMPKGEQESHALKQLVAAIGVDAAQTLMKVYGGARLYIPRCHAAMSHLRNQEFRQKVVIMVASGSTQTAAIRLYMQQYGFSERWAYMVLSEEAKRADTQMSLFN